MHMQTRRAEDLTVREDPMCPSPLGAVRDVTESTAVLFEPAAVGCAGPTTSGFG